MCQSVISSIPFIRISFHIITRPFDLLWSTLKYKYFVMKCQWLGIALNYLLKHEAGNKYLKFSLKSVYCLKNNLSRAPYSRDHKTKKQNLFKTYNYFITKLVKIKIIFSSLFHLIINVLPNIDNKNPYEVSAYSLLHTIMTSRPGQDFKLFSKCYQ